jgi:hypothetical protein
MSDSGQDIENSRVLVTEAFSVIGAFLRALLNCALAPNYLHCSLVAAKWLNNVRCRFPEADRKLL